MSRTYIDILKEFAKNGRMPRIILWTKLTPLLPYADTAHYAKDGVHPEGAAQRKIAENVDGTVLAVRCNRFAEIPND